MAYFTRDDVPESLRDHPAIVEYFARDAMLEQAIASGREDLRRYRAQEAIRVARLVDHFAAITELGAIQAAEYPEAITFPELVVAAIRAKDRRVIDLFMQYKQAMRELDEWEKEQAALREAEAPTET